MTEFEKYLISVFADKCPMDALNKRFGESNNICRGADQYKCRRDKESCEKCWSKFKSEFEED